MKPHMQGSIWEATNSPNSKNVDQGVPKGKEALDREIKETRYRFHIKMTFPSDKLKFTSPR